MPNKNESRWFAATWPVAVCLVLVLSGIAGCPWLTIPGGGGGGGGVVQPTTLVNESFGFVPAPRNFNPSAAGRNITVTVSGNATGSRISVIVTDLATGSVVAQQLLPTTNTTTVTFVSTNNGVHVATSAEVGAGSATYTIVVTEQ